MSLGSRACLPSLPSRGSGGSGERSDRVARLLRGVAAVLLPLAVVVASVGLPAGALPAAAAASSLTVEVAAPPARDGETTTATITVARAGAPVAGAAVAVERAAGAGWTPLDPLTTDASGAATVGVVLARSAADNRLRITVTDPQDAAPAVVEAALGLERRTAALTLRGPDAVVDGRRVVLQVGWRDDAGRPVVGPVRLERRAAGGDWRRVATLRTDASGAASVRLRPRVDTRYRARTERTDWLQAARSAVLLVDNLPPGRPVVLPASAPTPRITLPPQPRGVGSGANPRITAIPDAVWRSMVGRSWHAGCPVGRAGLRLLRINYWGFDGYRHRGELVAATGAVAEMAGALGDMYAARLPIRSMYLPDRFGWSRELQGADDRRSMAADNTSAFNCRWVVGNAGVRSPHARGRSLDVNPWENPYRSRQGIVPNRWWQFHSDPRVAWRSADHPVVRIMRANGLRWTYGLGDTQHFDA